MFKPSIFINAIIFAILPSILMTIGISIYIIQFISSDGKVMKELWTKETHQTIELTDFSVGTYIVNFVSESFKSTQLIALTY